MSFEGKLREHWRFIGRQTVEGVECYSWWWHIPDGHPDSEKWVHKVHHAPVATFWPTTTPRRQRFVDALNRWNRQLVTWHAQLGDFTPDTTEGKMLRLMIADGKAWRDHYQECLAET